MYTINDDENDHLTSGNVILSNSGYATDLLKFGFRLFQQNQVWCILICSSHNVL